MTLRWASMIDVDREREYSPSSCLPDGDGIRSGRRLMYRPV